MCRVLNNFGELAVRVLERHLQLADRLATIRHALPRSLTSFVDAAHTGRDIRDAAGGGGRAALSGIDEGLWEQEPEAAAAAKELKPADLLLADAFARQLRNVEGLLDACCLVVDTGSPGWSVVYADDTWKLWAGEKRFCCHCMAGTCAAPCIRTAPQTMRCVMSLFGHAPHVVVLYECCHE